MPGHGVAEPVEPRPAGVQPERPGYRRDPAAVLSEQTLRGESAAVLMREVHVAHRQRSLGPGEEHRGQRGLDEKPGQRVGRIDRDDERAVGRALAHVIEHLRT